jgi:lysophospholipase L1-like esterase
MRRRDFLAGGAALVASPAWGALHAGSVSTAGFHGFTGFNLPNWNTALGLRAAGTRNAKLVCVGDSTTMGIGADGSNHANGANLGWPAQLAQMVSNSGYGSWFGDHNVELGGTLTLAQFDTRVSIGSWVSTGNGTQTMGGPMMRATSASGGPLAFTPRNYVDTFDVYTFTNNVAASLSIQIDAGSATTLSQNSANSLVKTTLTTTLGSHALNVNWISGTPFLVGVYGYNSAAKEISIINAGISGGVVGTTTGTGWTSQSGNPWAPLAVLEAVAPDLTIINLNINDCNAGTAQSTYVAALQSIITAAKVSGDVIITSANPTTTSASLGTQATYVGYVSALATTNAIPFIDIFNLWGGVNQSQWMFNGLHPNFSGYTQIAGYILKAITPHFVSHA